jgi:hypothetical protein
MIQRPARKPLLRLFGNRIPEKNPRALLLTPAQDRDGLGSVTSGKTPDSLSHQRVDQSRFSAAGRTQKQYPLPVFFLKILDKLLLEVGLVLYIPPMVREVRS